MAHIHNNVGEHDNTVSAFIVRTDMGEPKVLMHKHKKLNVLLQIGGHVELKENPWEAIEHEIAEETGYSMSQLQVLQPPYFTVTSLPDVIVHPVPVCYSTHGFELWPDHKHTDVTYAFIADGEPTTSPSEGESVDLRWFSVSELEALTPDEVVVNIQQLGVMVLTTFLKHWVPVPATSFKTSLD